MPDDRTVQHVVAIEGPRDEIRFVFLAEGLHRIVADAAEVPGVVVP